MYNSRLADRLAIPSNSNAAQMAHAADAGNFTYLY